jgi:hypothetical protein
MLSPDLRVYVAQTSNCTPGVWSGIQNEHRVYAVNNVTATPNPDGSITVHFGGNPNAPTD